MSQNNVRGYKMNRDNVASSNLKSVGYDEGSSILEVEFHSGGIYEYFGVPEGVYLGLMSASSKGQYLHHYVKNSYRCNRIR